MKQFLAFLESFVVVALVLAGLVGLSYRVFRGGGWFETALERIAEIAFQHVTLSIVMAIAVIVPLVLWHNRHVAKGTHSKKVATIVLYFLMAAGAYFIGHYAILGTL